ncbi:hypothetical protein VKT23_015787 [Stygiomarasmius scandens]|uniref:Uncharacterized protein n=1 Tax=Marasmiellus scandens TaxID=2682957 RepID=A0ABR1IYS3_9AGAR
MAVTTVSSPTDEDLARAIAAIRQESPTLGRPKLLARLKTENNWNLSDARLKRFLNGQEAAQKYDAEKNNQNPHSALPSTDTNIGVTPSPGKVLLAIERILLIDPKLERSKIRAWLKAEYGWNISDKQIKAVMERRSEPGSLLMVFALTSPDSSGEERNGTVFRNDSCLSAMDMVMNLFDKVDSLQMTLPAAYKPRIPSMLETARDAVANIHDKSGRIAPLLPKGARNAQFGYLERKQRNMILIYGRGKWDYAVMPTNPEMRIYLPVRVPSVLIGSVVIHTFCDIPLFKVAHSELKANLPERIYSLDHKLVVASSEKILTLWEFYEAAAKKAGISRYDVGRQFEAEFEVNMHHYVPSREISSDIDSERQIRDWEEDRRRVWKEGKEPILRMLGVTDWNEDVHGQFAVTVTKVDKESGQECGYI